MTPRLLSTSQAADLLGVSRDSVLRLVHSGSLPYVDVSAKGERKRLRIDTADLEAWIAAHKVGGPANGEPAPR